MPRANPCAKAHDQLARQHYAVVGSGSPRDDRTGMLTHPGVFVWARCWVYIFLSSQLSASPNGSNHIAGLGAPKEKHLYISPLRKSGAQAEIRKSDPHILRPVPAAPRQAVAWRTRMPKRTQCEEVSRPQSRLNIFALEGSDRALRTSSAALGHRPVGSLIRRTTRRLGGGCRGTRPET